MYFSYFHERKFIVSTCQLLASLTVIYVGYSVCKRPRCPQTASPKFVSFFRAYILT